MTLRLGGTLAVLLQRVCIRLSSRIFTIHPVDAVAAGQVNTGPARRRPYLGAVQVRGDETFGAYLRIAGGMLALLDGERFGRRGSALLHSRCHGDRRPEQLGADQRRVAARLTGAIGMEGLRDRVGQAVEPLRAVTNGVTDEGVDWVDESEALGRSSRGDPGVDLIGGRVESGLIIR